MFSVKDYHRLGNFENSVGTSAGDGVSVANSLILIIIKQVNGQKGQLFGGFWPIRLFYSSYLCSRVIV